MLVKVTIYSNSNDELYNETVPSIDEAIELLEANKYEFDARMDEYTNE